MWLNIAFSIVIAAFMRSHLLISIVLIISLVVHIYIKRDNRVLLYIFTVFSFYFHFEQPTFSEFDWNESPKQIQGTIRFLDDLNIQDEKMTGSFTYKSEKIRFNYYLKDAELMNVPYYNQCNVIFDVKRPLPNANGLKFDYDSYLYSQQINFIATIKKINSCKQSDLSVFEQILNYRVHLSDTLHSLPIDHTDYLCALTLGDTRFIESDEMTHLKLLGIYHLFAISGSHVALISVQLYFVLKRLLLPIKYSLSIILILLPIYAVLTGLSPSVLRATLFIIIYLIIKKYVSMIDALAISFILFMIVLPELIYDVGFQLSYFITFIMILCSSDLERLHPIRQFILLTIISQMASIPIIVFHFNVIQFNGFIANLFFIPFFSWIIFPVCTIVLLIVALQLNMPLFILSFLNVALNTNHMLMDVFSLFLVRDLVIKSTDGIIVVIIIALFVILSVIRDVKAFYLICVLFILIAFYSLIDAKGESVTFLDVGQGDATLIMDNEDAIVVDTGGKISFNQKETHVANHSLLPMLKEEGIQSIHTLILTHPDYDHYGDALFVMQNIHVKQIIINKSAPKFDKYKEVIDYAEKHNIKIIDAQTVNSINLKHTRISFFNQNESYIDENDSSIVTLIEQHSNKILLMADLPSSKEYLIPCNDIDVLKVGHHGSHTSTTDALLDCVTPEIAVISAGRHNRFGHPAKEIISKLNKKDITVLSTQDVGAIKVNEHITTAKTKKVRR